MSVGDVVEERVLKQEQIGTEEKISPPLSGLGLGLNFIASPPQHIIHATRSSHALHTRLTYSSYTLQTHHTCHTLPIHATLHAYPITYRLNVASYLSTSLPLYLLMLSFPCGQPGCNQTFTRTLDHTNHICSHHLSRLSIRPNNYGQPQSLYSPITRQ